MQEKHAPMGADTTISTAVSTLAGGMGLPGLDGLLGKWRSGGLYLIRAEHTETLHRLLAHIALSNLTLQPTVLITSRPPDEWPEQDKKAELAASASKGLLSVWLPRAGRPLAGDMGDLLADMAPGLPRRPGLLLWHDPVELLRSLSNAAARRHLALRDFLHQRGHACVLAIDPQSRPIEEGFGPLLGWRDQLTGLIHLSENLLEIAHWHGSDGTLCGQRYRLHWHEEGITVDDIDDLPVEKGNTGISASPPDSEGRRFLATLPSLQGNDAAESDWLCFPDTDTLVEAAVQLPAAAILLHYDSETSATTLEQAVNSLRLQQGASVPILIVERGRYLRHAQGMRLLRSGATQILPDMAPAALKRIAMACSRLRILHPDPMTLPPDEPITVEKSFVPIRRFSELVRTVTRRNADLGIECAVIRLTPLDGLELSDIAGTCHPQRNTDWYTFDNQYLYVFLDACRDDAIDIALDHFFTLPPDEVFAWDQRFVTPSDIYELLDALETRSGPEGLPEREPSVSRPATGASQSKAAVAQPAPFPWLPSPEIAR